MAASLNDAMATSEETQVVAPPAIDSTSEVVQKIPESIMLLDDMAQNYYLCIRMAGGLRSTLMYKSGADCMRDALSKYHQLRRLLENPCADCNPFEVEE